MDADINVFAGSTGVRGKDHSRDEKRIAALVMLIGETLKRSDHLKSV